MDRLDQNVIAFCGSLLFFAILTYTFSFWRILSTLLLSEIIFKIVGGPYGTVNFETVLKDFLTPFVIVNLLIWMIGPVLETVIGM